MLNIGLVFLLVRSLSELIKPSLENSLKNGQERCLMAIILVALVSVAVTRPMHAQQANPPDGHSAVQSGEPHTAPPAEFGPSVGSERERLLLERINQLEQRLARLESQAAMKSACENSAFLQPAVMPVQQAAAPGTPSEPPRDQDAGVLEFFRDTTINLTVDGYYGFNFNRPVGRINLLRAYDVLSDNFSLNQASLVIERAPNVPAGRRFGARVDLQYGQATETLQGSAVNEPRPQVYRALFQAYGTYVVPVGRGLTVDFGKWASPLGFENNYTKDQINYARSYYFNFLPFYHFGFRANYEFSNRLSVLYGLVNGVQQSEGFNGFKSQALWVTIKPTKTVSWNVNYFTGIQSRDTQPALNPGLPSLPTQPGLSTAVIRPRLKGRLHILDTYASWKPNDKVTLAGEADYAINREQRTSQPSRVSGGAAYARYQFVPKFALAARAEYLSDRGGLFSGVTQALKETTLTADYNVANGFLIRGEWRRDFSNRPFFLTVLPDVLKKEQNTLTLGLVWWFGRKEGAW